MRANGWYRESFRHSLAARGVITKRYMATKAAPRVIPESRLTKAVGSAEKGLQTQIRSERIAEADIEARSPEQQALDLIKRGQATDIQKELLSKTGKKETFKQLERQGQRRQHKDSIFQKGLGKTEELTAKFRRKIAREEDIVLTDLEQAEVAAIAEKAVEDSLKGVPVSERTKEVLKKFKTLPAARNALQQLTVAEEAERREREGFVAKELRQAEEQTLIDLANAPAEAADVAGRGVVGAGRGILETTREGLRGTKFQGGEGPGVRQKIDAFGNTSFVGTNVAIGNEEDGLLRPIQEPLPPLSSGFDEALAVSERTRSSNMLFKKRQKNFSDLVDDQVNQLYTSKDKLSKVDLEPFKWGTKAFESGDREGVIKAISELKREEDKIASRWALVDQTNKNITSVNNHQSLFQDPGTDNIVLQSGKGANRLAEQTEKIEEVFKGMKDSNDKVFARRRMLQFRLQRMDANVLPEQGAPDFDQITRFSGDEKVSKGIDWTNTPELLTKGNPGLKVFK